MAAHEHAAPLKSPNADTANNYAYNIANNASPKRSFSMMQLPSHATTSRKLIAMRQRLSRIEQRYPEVY